MTDNVAPYIVQVEGSVVQLECEAAFGYLSDQVWHQWQVASGACRACVHLRSAALLLATRF